MQTRRRANSTWLRRSQEIAVRMLDKMEQMHLTQPISYDLESQERPIPMIADDTDIDGSEGGSVPDPFFLIR